MQLEKPSLSPATLKTLEAVVGADFAKQANWVRPVHIGGWNLVFVFELVASNSRVVIRLPRPHVAYFAREKTSLEVATMNFLSQHTKLSIPTLFSSGKHPDVGYYLISEFVENNGLLSRALAKPEEDEDEAPVLNLALLGCELEAHLYDVWGGRPAAYPKHVQYGIPHQSRAYNSGSCLSSHGLSLGNSNRPFIQRSQRIPNEL